MTIGGLFKPSMGYFPKPSIRSAKGEKPDIFYPE